MNETEINNLKSLDVCGTDTLKTLNHKTFSQFSDSITHEYQINTKVHVLDQIGIRWGTKHVIHQKLANFRNKKDMLTILEVPSSPCNYLFYRPEYNITTGPHET